MVNPKLIKAIALAFERHKGAKRKGKETSFVVHPLEVMNILLEEKGYDKRIDDDIIIAGVCHDLVEDTSTTIGEISKLFGKEVARIVEAESEPEELKKNPDKKTTWKKRKEHTIKRLNKADFKVKIVACADKLHNFRDLREDYEYESEKCWDKFNAPKEEIEWYYRSIVKVLKTGGNGESIQHTRLFKLLDKEVNEFFS
jgi:(p)ppGpp synthase/HD superfamily hydrolase